MLFFHSPSEIQVPFDTDAIPNTTLLNSNYPPFQLAGFLFAYFVRGYSLPSWTWDHCFLFSLCSLSIKYHGHACNCHSVWKSQLEIPQSCQYTSQQENFQADCFLFRYNNIWIENCCPCKHLTYIAMFFILLCHQ